MYTTYFNLSGRPFKLSPDHRFYFDGQPHRRAIAYLTYGLSQGDGFVVVTGEVGAGKTTLIDHLLSRLQGNNIITAKISTTHIEGDNLLRLVASAFGIAQEGVDKATMLGRIETFLIDQNRCQRRSLLIIDEVQNLTHSALEELRMLSNFQLDGSALLQTYLIGQPEFRQTLASPDLEQLRQRVVTSYHLQALDAAETAQYIKHRLAQVGWQGNPSFTPATFERVYDETAGVPRRINLLCDRLLLFGYLEQKTELDGTSVDAVVADMRAEGLHGPAAVQPRPGPGQGPEAAPTGIGNGAGAEINALSRRLSELEQRLQQQRDRVSEVLAETTAELAMVEP